MLSIHVEGETAFETPRGRRLVLAIEDAGIDILHRCGGYGRCTTCRVEVLAGDAGPRTQRELDRLADEADLPENTRLACQVQVRGDLTLRVPLRLSSSGMPDAGPRPKDEITPPPGTRKESECAVGHSQSMSPAVDPVDPAPSHPQRLTPSPDSTGGPMQHHAQHGSHDMHGLAQRSGTDFDRAYLSMMIAHHQGAIEMSRAALERLQDSQVRGWTDAILDVQDREIQDMTTWLTELGGRDKAMYKMMAGEMEAMTQELIRASDSDRALIEGMVPHHAGAVEMAILALQKSADARVLALSRDIIRAQATELYDYRMWLAQRAPGG